MNKQQSVVANVAGIYVALERALESREEVFSDLVTLPLVQTLREVFSGATIPGTQANTALCNLSTTVDLALKRSTTSTLIIVSAKARTKDRISVPVPRWT
jgi:hypothetical protein